MSSRESYTSVINRKAAAKQQLMNVAMGRERADLVLKNAVYVNVFTNELSQGDIAVKNGVIAGIGHYDGVEELDMQGKIVAPGLIDAHIHLESSLVAPSEFVKAVLPHGTATVITDPHEIANVLGTDGIDYMIQATEGLPVEVRFMLPSCVPATPLDESGARLDYQAIDPFYDYDRIQGLDVMMPRMDGLEVCRRIRKAGNTPVMMLTAKGETFDKVLGLELGADDYMVKPFDAKEVVARIKAVLRRCQTTSAAAESTEGVIEFDNLRLDMNSYELRVKGKVVEAKRDYTARLKEVVGLCVREFYKT